MYRYALILIIYRKTGFELQRKMQNKRQKDFNNYSSHALGQFILLEKKTRKGEQVKTEKYWSATREKGKQLRPANVCYGSVPGHR